MKNLIQFQKGYSLAEFLQDYGTEEKCEKSLFASRWPDGYVCPACGSSSYCTLKTRALYQCNRCHHQQSLISGTIFAASKLPLTTWFLAIHLLTQAKTGLSAMALRRQLGVSYNTAWSIKQKLMQVMKERDDKKPLSGTVQLDDAYWGGECRGGKRGRGSPNKIPFVAAVSVDNQGHPIALRMTVVKGFRRTEIETWAKRHLLPGTRVVSDGLDCFQQVEAAGCVHTRIITGGGPNSVALEAFTWVNTALGNVKRAMNGVYHAMSAKHLPRYLAEFSYRFNRRFRLEDLLPRLVYAAVRTPPMPGRLLKLAENYG